MAFADGSTELCLFVIMQSHFKLWRSSKRSLGQNGTAQRREANVVVIVQNRIKIFSISVIAFKFS